MRFLSLLHIRQNKIANNNSNRSPSLSITGIRVFQSLNELARELLQKVCLCKLLLGEEELLTKVRLWLPAHKGGPKRYRVKACNSICLDQSLTTGWGTLGKLFTGLPTSCTGSTFESEVVTSLWVIS